MYCVGSCMQLEALCTCPTINLCSFSNNCTCYTERSWSARTYYRPKGGTEVEVSLWDGPDEICYDRKYLWCVLGPGWGRKILCFEAPMREDRANDPF